MVATSKSKHLPDTIVRSTTKQQTWERTLEMDF